MHTTFFMVTTVLFGIKLIVVVIGLVNSDLRLVSYIDVIILVHEYALLQEKILDISEKKVSSVI